MPMPKSITRIKKGNVEYISSVNRVMYTMDELERAALKDVAKFLRAEMRKRLKSTGSVKTRNLSRAVTSWVRKGSRGYQTKLQIGFYSNAKAKSRGLNPAFYGSMLEFGTKKLSARPWLRPAVYENIPKIIEIESKYLSGLEDEAKALRLIDEREEETNAE